MPIQWGRLSARWAAVTPFAAFCRVKRLKARTKGDVGLRPAHLDPPARSRCLILLEGGAGQTGEVTMLIGLNLEGASVG